MLWLIYILILLCIFNYPPENHVCFYFKFAENFKIKGIFRNFDNLPKDS